MPKSGIVRKSLLHLPQVGLPETPAVIRVLMVVASGSRPREARCLDELLDVAAYDLREGVAETPELTELDFRFLLLLSEHSPLCLLILFECVRNELFSDKGSRCAETPYLRTDCNFRSVRAQKRLFCARIS